MPISPYEGLNPPLHHDARVAGAMREIFETTSVKTVCKRKTLNKFGARFDLGTDVAVIKTWSTPEEYQSSNVQSYVVSTNAADTGEVVVETMVLVNGKFVFTEQRVSLTGQTPAPIPVPCARWMRAYVNDGAVGDVWVFREGATVTFGVPDLPHVHNHIPAGLNQSQKCATTIAHSNFFLLEHLWASLVQKASEIAAVQLRVREYGHVFRTYPQRAISSDSSLDHVLRFLAIIPPGADIEISGQAGSANTWVTAGFSGVFADIV